MQHTPAMQPAQGPRAQVEARDTFLRVRFATPSPDTADFHYFWLRHNCDCCRHPLTGERILCSSSVPLDVHPASAALAADGASVDVTWDENGGTHRSVYPLSWLRAHAYALNRNEVAPPASDLMCLEVHRNALAPATALHALCADYLDRHGAIVVRDAGVDTEALIDEFLHGGWRLIETHFGRIEDLRTDNTTNQNTDQLGYTDAAVDLHTDQPFLDVPPRLQMLHCMHPADVGGESVLVDARQAALYLRSIDAHAFELLTTVPVRFHRKQKQFERVVISPIIEMRDGAVFRVRSSYFTMAPHIVPFERMEQWYRAYNRFTFVTRDARHQYRFLLRAGDFLLYDNYRMLHARTGFTGPRWLRGVYFN
jgi:gamma-butyrobetaine dioxygenase